MEQLTRGQIDSLIQAHQEALDGMELKTGPAYERVERAVKELIRLREQSGDVTEQRGPLGLLVPAES